MADGIIRLQAEKQNTLTRNAEKETYRQRIIDMMEFLDGQGNALTEYDDNLTRRLVERVTVYESRLVIIFRSGVEIEVEP